LCPRASVPIVPAHLQRMPLPTKSVSEFTECSVTSESEIMASPQHLPLCGVRIWETMSVVYERSSCRTRNLHLVTCSLMRLVTDLRSVSRHHPIQGMKRRLRELESDCTAATFALPYWFSNPSHNAVRGETDVEHRDRLHTLLLWHW
jgi:hypothetical protein